MRCCNTWLGASRARRRRPNCSPPLHRQQPCACQPQPCNHHHHRRWTPASSGWGRSRLLNLGLGSTVRHRHHHPDRRFTIPIAAVFDPVPAEAASKGKANVTTVCCSGFWPGRSSQVASGLRPSVCMLVIIRPAIRSAPTAWQGNSHQRGDLAVLVCRFFGFVGRLLETLRRSGSCPCFVRSEKNK